jgi:hypothetical protein
MNLEFLGGKTPVLIDKLFFIGPQNEPWWSGDVGGVGEAGGAGEVDEVGDEVGDEEEEGKLCFLVGVDFGVNSMTR